MKFGQIASVAVLLAGASLSRADFTVTATQGPSADGMDRYDIVAVNNGNGTGTLLKAMEYFYAGTKAFFEVLDTPDNGSPTDGVPDTVNTFSTTRSRIRVGTTPNGAVVFGSPTLGFTQPNPYLNGISYFEGAMAATTTTPASGAGFEVARLYVASGGHGTLRGKLGGNTGLALPFSVSFGPTFNNPHSPTISPIGLVAGQVLPNGDVAFSANAQVSDLDASDELSLTLALLGGVNDVHITGGGSGTQQFNLSGTILKSNFVPGFEIKLVADDGQGGTGNGSFRVVVPEPTCMFGLLGGLSLIRRSR